MSTRHFPGRTVLFEKATSGMRYRVPALLYIPSVAKLLAFAEQRLSVDDADANLLVLRRGTFYMNSVQWEDMQIIETATLMYHRSMNPCPIYDEVTGMVFLFFIAVLGRTSEVVQIVTGQNAARLCYVFSSDQGISWSQVTDLTEEVIGMSIQDWATFALGPGHGIQLKSGRLLLPAYTYYIDCKKCFGKLCKTTPHAFAFHSDDHGQSWFFGEFVPNLKSVECQMVAVDEEDGSRVLLCNARSPLGFRVQALSTDDGAAFHSGQLVTPLVEPPHGCHGSIIGFPAPLYRMRHDIQVSQRKACPVKGPLQPGIYKRLHFCPARLSTSLCHHYLCHQQLERVTSTATSSGHLNSTLSPMPWNMTCTDQHHNNAETVSSSDTYFEIPTWVLYSHPTSSTSRENLGIYLNPFPRDVDSWSKPWVIYEGPSAYSDLAFIELSHSESSATGTPAFACVYENGTQSPYEQISFSMFTLHDVLQNIPLITSSPSQKESSKGRKRKRGKCAIF
ncbi:sialidase-4 [Erythrolamprus reginae]|uniref:sialidase-4 n=1 Tax=Erythrolamprus reginae TaxID=121349 RepID=UPI00396CD33C